MTQIFTIDLEADALTGLRHWLQRQYLQIIAPRFTNTHAANNSKNCSSKKQSRSSDPAVKYITWSER
ncbi:MAG: hypothetical protein KME27_01145 [Lyngbya sp. HA4199-MV5]|nr:hypothetical protein [Lyngbya sp. HA4199-MV5]